MRSNFVRASILFGGFLVVLSSAQAQVTQPASKLRELIDHLAANDKFMGTIKVSQNGKLLFQQQCGVIANNGKEKTPPNAATQYRIGSISKTFTAVMIMQLIEEQKLSLDGKLADFFPELPSAQQVSIRQLLGHQSGIGSITEDPTYPRWHRDVKTRAEMIKIIARQPNKFAPGEKAQYSNSNYVLLGFIIEKLSGQTYSEQLQTRICDKIGLKRTAYMTNADAEKNVALSFRWSGKNWLAAEQTDPSVPHGAGAIMSTPTDLIRFAEALFDGKLVDVALVKEMKPSGLGMGHGLFGIPFGKRIAFGHNGGIDGFQSMLGHFENDDVTVALIGNGVNYSVNDIMIGVLSIVFEQPYELPEFSDIKVSEKVLQQYAGVYARSNFPLKITVTVNDGQLVAQGTGQPSFSLTASSETEFRSDIVGVVTIFSKSDAASEFDTMLLKQGGANLEFRKE